MQHAETLGKKFVFPDEYTDKCSCRAASEPEQEQDPVAVLLANQRRLLDEDEEYSRYLKTVWPTPDFAEVVSRYKGSLDRLLIERTLFQASTCTICFYALTYAFAE